MRAIAVLGCAALAAAALAIRTARAESPRARTTMAHVGPAVYRPFYPAVPEEKEVPVKAFWIDRVAVTNGEFLSFVRAHPEWQRGRVAPIFADGQYLAHWASPADLGRGVDARQPVVHVSWFAAKAYCAARGARLPTEAEWEVAGWASRTHADGRQDAPWRKQLLAQYSAPVPQPLPRVGSTPPNFWGVSDMHGVIWEWVLDFNGAMVRMDASSCGGGVYAVDDKTDFPSFMRMAFRNSLHGDYTTGDLGFRCAADDAEGAR